MSTTDERIHSIGPAIDWAEPAESVPIPDGTRAVWPPKRPDGQDGRWRVTAESARELVEKGFLRVGPYIARSDRHSFAYLQGGVIDRISTGEVVVDGYDSKGAAQVRFAAATKTATPKTVWTLASHDASRHGANLLRSMLPGRNFPYPKSLYAVEDCLRFATRHKRHAVILDFFAGSGTTAHAVMRLNRQDGGERTSISITNNEVSADEQKALRSQGLRPGDPDWEQWGICDYITKPRIRSAIEGTTPDGDPISAAYKFTDPFPMSDGFQENVEFFTLTYEARRPVAQNKSFAAVAPLLWLRAGGKGRRIENITEPFDIADTYGILFDLDHSRQFLEALAATEGARVAYIVTDDEPAYQAVVDGLSGVEPVRLYESYLTNFRYNAEVES